MQIYFQVCCNEENCENLFQFTVLLCQFIDILSLFLIDFFIIVFYIILINNTINLFFHFFLYRIFYYLLCHHFVHHHDFHHPLSSILLIKHQFFSDLIGALLVHVLVSNSNKLHKDLLQEYNDGDHCTTTIFFTHLNTVLEFISKLCSERTHIYNSVANLKILFSTK